ncbi:hypothetical protein Q8W40_24410 [Vibrio penaeicida]|uniref:hypothetical protein n=1 Tax=Vibrio penaeicida TaxID=104609 RepID=UPI0027324D20|nr:hypothetical protein [Vibrio penaeicida]MDP2575361.1 hypothetical protein [Vibrio penaeicida]
MTKKGYKREHIFPNESYVQEAIDRYFLTAGYEIIDDKYTDLVCKHPSTKETWYIEAKGLTSQVGLDFRTCIGQVVQRMKVQGANYAIAVPDIQKFRDQLLIVAPHVREILNLYWVLVDENQSVVIVSPEQNLHNKLPKCDG